MTLWTPGGEHTPEPEGASTGGKAPGPVADGPALDDLSPEDRAQLEAMQEQMAEVRAQLLAAPAEVVVANHAMGIYELAALHLTAEQPKLAEASLAIDALAALVDSLAGRLGESEPTLHHALAQLRAAYLEVRGRIGDAGAGGA
jgi:hypothetical protein